MQLNKRRCRAVGPLSSDTPILILFVSQYAIP